MLAMILSWVRASVKAAFLAGIQDAVAELDRGAVGDDGKAVESLRERFAIEDKSGKKGGKS